MRSNDGFNSHGIRRHDDYGTAILESLTTSTQTIKIPIEQIPLGARVPTVNPRPWERDNSLPEPNESTWVAVSFTIERSDGGIVDAEFLRPRSWVEGYGIEAGQRFPLTIEELEIEGFAHVNSVSSSIRIASGEGSTVTGKFVTREVDVIACIEVLGADGQVETIEGTTIHPIWSLDRDDWVSLGDVEEGEKLLGDSDAVVVLTHTVLRRSSPVYNIEVHGEHVDQVGLLGLLVHNACNPLRTNMIAEWGDEFMEGLEAAHIIPKNGWKWAPDALHEIIDNVKNVGLIDDIANGFASTAGHAGTHTRAYVDDVIEIMKGRTSRESIIEGMDELWDLINAGIY